MNGLANVAMYEYEGTWRTAFNSREHPVTIRTEGKTMYLAVKNSRTKLTNLGIIKTQGGR